ncbi:MAG: hypothetical protein R2789_03390 [Microthrixaceae bacterium]
MRCRTFIASMLSPPISIASTPSTSTVPELVVLPDNWSFVPVQDRSATSPGSASRTTKGISGSQTKVERFSIATEPKSHRWKVLPPLSVTVRPSAQRSHCCQWASL